MLKDEVFWRFCHASSLLQTPDAGEMKIVTQE
jgi:hypothetical protein